MRVRARCSWGWLFGWLAWGLAGAAGPAWAQGFLLTHPARETSMLESTEPWRARGTFTLSPTGLRLTAPAPFGENYFFPAGDAAEVNEGFIRARFVVGSRLDSTLLFRAQIDADDDDALSGYGFSIEKDRVRFYRWDAGVVRYLGAEWVAPGLQDRTRIEVNLFLVGPYFHAILYDGDQLTPLGTLSVSDGTYRTGRLGVRAHAQQDPESRLETFRVHRPAAPAAPTPRPTAPDPTGHERLVYIAEDDVSRLPKAEQARVIRDVDLDDVGAAVVLVTDLYGLERIYRAGITPRRVEGKLPRSLIDPAYRRAKSRGPIATKTGVDLDESYKDAEMVREILNAYAARFPDRCRLEELGRSHQGRPILALKISDHPEVDEHEPAVLFNAAHHGSELLSVEMALDVIGRLVEGYPADPAVRNVVNALEIWVVPMVNPDGNMAFMKFGGNAGRKNGRDLDGDGVFEEDEGVDLNRNYPFLWGALGEQGSRSQRRHGRYRGEAPASEPETQAMIRLADREHFVASISFHTSGTLVLSPYTIDGAANPVPDVPWAIAEALVKAMPIQPNRKRYRVQRKMYAVDGTDQDWHYFTHGTVALLLEGPLHNPSAPRQRIRSVEQARPGWRYLLDRVRQGPRLSGVVRDPAGHPLTAEVRIEETQLQNGEIWTSRPKDGRFDRLLAGPGTYSLTVRRDGFVAHEAKVRVSSRPRFVEVVLHPKPENVGEGHP